MSLQLIRPKLQFPFTFRMERSYNTAKAKKGIHLRHEFCNWGLPFVHRLPQSLSIQLEGPPKWVPSEQLEGNSPAAIFHRNNYHIQKPLTILAHDDEDLL